MSVSAKDLERELGLGGNPSEADNPYEELLQRRLSERAAAPRRMSAVEVPKDELRLSTGVPGLDLCLSEHDDVQGGPPLGISYLLAGQPGGGKSTITAVMADAAGSTTVLEDGFSAPLIIAGEERESRVRQRWDRLGLGKKGADPLIVRRFDGEEIAALIMQLQPRLTIVDSIQALSFNGSSKYDAQYEAVRLLEMITVGLGASIVFVSHVDKKGTAHAGAQGLPHLVDIHVHVAHNAKKSERALEVRKNRVGRAGFQVPLYLGPTSVSVGTPAPITGNGSMEGARTKLEMARDKAYELLMKGRAINGYDFDEVPGISGGMWRAGMSMAVKAAQRDGFEVEEFKVNNRTHYRCTNPPPDPEAPLLVGEQNPYGKTGTLVQKATEIDVAADLGLKETPEPAKEEAPKVSDYADHQVPELELD